MLAQLRNHAAAAAVITDDGPVTYTELAEARRTSNPQVRRRARLAPPRPVPANDPAPAGGA
jgi:hypothetical protein